MKLECSQYICEKEAKISNFIKIHPEGAELFCVDRRTDMTKLTVAFHNFMNTPNKQFHTDSLNRNFIVQTYPLISSNRAVLSLGFFMAIDSTAP
jgi:hypothetical protein